VIEQIKAGNRSITGVMIESNLQEGNQSSEQPRADMRYGVSVTDACINWESTETLLREMHQQLGNSLKSRNKGV
jgi:3-deoxy-7-phosphoheptulonate synthase